MTTANYLINALAAQEQEEADIAFDAAIQERLADYLEVRKVELASTIMDDLQEGKGMDAQRRWVRQVAAIGKEYSSTGLNRKVSIHRGELKNAARKYFQTYKPHGVEFVEKGTAAVRDARKAVKAKRLQGEETIVESEHTAAHELALYADNDSHLYRTSHQPIIANLQRKVKKGIYDHEKAKTLWKYHADRAAMRYAKEHGDGHTPWHQMFTPSDRRKAASHFADQAKEHLGLNESLDETTGAILRKVIPGLGKFTAKNRERKARFQAYGPGPISDDPSKHSPDDKLRLRLYKKASKYQKIANEALEGGSKSTAVASNQQLGRNVVANIRRATQALGIRGVNPSVAAAAHKDFARLVAKNPRAPGYMLLRKLAPSKAAAVQSLTQAGVPLGSALDAHPTEFNQVVQKIKRFQ